jgi:hypothetical protein
LMIFFCMCVIVEALSIFDYRNGDAWCCHKMAEIHSHSVIRNWIFKS